MSVPPYQSSISEREIETPLGSTSVPASDWVRRSSRVYQPAASISEPSTSTRVLSARPVKPTMRLAGIGQGWLPK